MSDHDEAEAAPSTLRSARASGRRFRPAARLRPGHGRDCGAVYGSWHDAICCSGDCRGDAAELGVGTPRSRPRGGHGDCRACCRGGRSGVVGGLRQSRPRAAAAADRGNPGDAAHARPQQHVLGARRVLCRPARRLPDLAAIGPSIGAAGRLFRDCRRCHHRYRRLCCGTADGRAEAVAACLSQQDLGRHGRCAGGEPDQAALFWFAVPEGSAVRLAATGAMLSFVAQAGDLAESAIKRRFGAKDTSL